MSDNGLIITKLDENREEETEGGLIVPSHAIQREQETWINDDIKKFDRAIFLAKDRELEIVMICQKCHQPLRVVEREDGRLALQCKHKDRVFKRDVR